MSASPPPHDTQDEERQGRVSTKLLVRRSFPARYILETPDLGSHGHRRSKTLTPGSCGFKGMQHPLHVLSPHVLLPTFLADVSSMSIRHNGTHVTMLTWCTAGIRLPRISFPAMVMTALMNHGLLERSTTKCSTTSQQMNGSVAWNSPGWDGTRTSFCRDSRHPNLAAVTFIAS